MEWNIFSTGEGPESDNTHQGNFWTTHIIIYFSYSTYYMCGGK